MEFNRVWLQRVHSVPPTDPARHEIPARLSNVNRAVRHLRGAEEIAREEAEVQMKPGWKLLSVSTILALSVALTGCQGLGTANNSQSNATPPPPPPISNPQGLQKLNHIIFMAQENRSFDNYFGQLSACWN